MCPLAVMVSIQTAVSSALAMTYVQRAELRIGVFVADALSEGAHSFLRLYGLGSNGVGNLEVQGDVFAALSENHVSWCAAK